MEKIILVHGINNQGKSEERIIGEWLGALQTALTPQELELLHSKEIVAPYYGNILKEITDSGDKIDKQAVAQSILNLDDPQAKFISEAMTEMALGAGMHPDILDAENGDQAVEQSLKHNRYLNAVVRFLEGKSPWHGDHAVRFLKQAYVYLNRAHAAKAVDDIVAPNLNGPRSLIIAHSLGTIVTFKALRNINTELKHNYITLGSPLGIRAIRKKIGPPYQTPTCTSVWNNGLDKDDFITLGKRLSEHGYNGHISENDKIDNGRKDPHSIAKYITDPWVVAQIKTALGLEQ